MESFTTTLDLWVRPTVPPKTGEVKSSGRWSIGAKSRNYRPCTICRRRKTKCEIIEGQVKCKFCLHKGIKCVVEDIHECSSSPSKTEISGTDVYPPHPDNTDAHDDHTFSTPSPQDKGYTYTPNPFTTTYFVHLGQGLPNQEPSAAAAQTYCEMQDDMLGQTSLDVPYANNFGEFGCGQHCTTPNLMLASQTPLEAEPWSFGHQPTTPNPSVVLVVEETIQCSAVQGGLSLDNPENTSKTPRTGDSPIFYEVIPLGTSFQPGSKIENEDTGAYSPVSSFGSTSSLELCPPPQRDLPA